MTFLVYEPKESLKTLIWFLGAGAAYVIQACRILCRKTQLVKKARKHKTLSFYCPSKANISGCQIAPMITYPGEPL